MREKILEFVAVVAGGYIVKGLLLPVLASMIADGPEDATRALFWLSYAAGSFCLVLGVPTIASAIADKETNKRFWSALGVTFGIIILFG